MNAYPARYRILLLLSALLFLLVPRHVYAHASLKTANPAPDSELISSPAEISLVFNERLERELYDISLYDHHGKKLATAAPEMSPDQQEIHLSLPALSDGAYTVSYRVISDDGHPVQSSYVIRVGKAGADDGAAAGVSPAANQPQTPASPLFWAARVIFFLSMLLLTGLLLWGRHLPGSAAKCSWLFGLQAAFLLSFTVTAGLQLPVFLGSWDTHNFLKLLTGTRVGWSWLLTLGLSLCGFFILRRLYWLDATWALLLLAAKSLSGHAAGTHPAALTIPLDGIHLLAAAVWSGGLFYIGWNYGKERERVQQFLPLFSRAALLSLIVLTVTGAISVLLFLPEWNYVLYTQWGRWLLAKVAAVVCVLAVGAGIRRSMKLRGVGRIGALVKIDFSLMVLIMFIVGVFTYLSPLPINRPVIWAEDGKQLQLLAEITPDAAGNSQFRVHVTVPPTGEPVKNVQMTMHCHSEPGVAPINVPLDSQPAGHADAAGHDHSDADSSYVYQGEGCYIPFAGKWTVELRVQDAADNESVFSKDIVVF